MKREVPYTLPATPVFPVRSIVRKIIGRSSVSQSVHTPPPSIIWHYSIDRPSSTNIIHSQKSLVKNFSSHIPPNSPNIPVQMSNLTTTPLWNPNFISISKKWKFPVILLPTRQIIFHFSPWSSDIFWKIVTDQHIFPCEERTDGDGNGNPPPYPGTRDSPQKDDHEEWSQERRKAHRLSAKSWGFILWCWDTYLELLREKLDTPLRSLPT